VGIAEHAAHEEQKQDLGAKLRLIAAKVLVGMIGCWVAQWVWWVGLHPAGWRLVSSLLHPRSFFGVDDEPRRECFFMKVTQANNRPLLFLQVLPTPIERNYDDLGCILSHW